jgi:hypothetical protein
VPDKNNGTERFDGLGNETGVVFGSPHLRGWFGRTESWQVNCHGV